MGTEILRPQDCLIERIRVPPVGFSRRRNYGNPNFNNNHYASNPKVVRKPVARPERVDQRKRVVSETSVPRRSSSGDLKTVKNSPMMEKVTILGRGESLDSKINSKALKKDGDDVVVTGTERLGPDPEMVPKQIRIVDMRSGFSQVGVKGDMYAGSAFAMSPAPSSLPLPSFSTKKQSSAIVDDSATRDLRRLLRLE
ncbi:Proline-rich nuclear receptor coactivator [Quillaja saponaria]|uniref:Proline-rich nuclear receptor coactivator n=1 Tax=Quillaja saponaria TaxID=32244 RepID=A0AAD7LBF5_QUISA|nr:Proline-rich nuclear receptor coactivator [Quillaja saponaria]